MKIGYLMIMGVLLKNFIRIYEKKDNKYFSYPWPKMYSFTEKNNRNKNIKIYSKNNEFIYYKPNPYTLCMFSESPCTSNQDVGEIQLKKKFGYKIYYYKTN